MKTTVKISALSLVLLFAVSTAMSLNIGGAEKAPPAMSIYRHVVKVLMPGEFPVCGTYVVEIHDVKGNLVAPAKAFVPGMSDYVFYERASESGSKGPRIATLRKVGPTGGAQCLETLRVVPAVVRGPFEAGKTYIFNLYPKVQGQIE
jgi:hypothetical protein